ncbi:MAG: O-antigen ligase family protein [Acidisphaera sp.]|nr:O-antigen ligase family protein [Acidisphaera sp.]
MTASAEFLAPPRAGEVSGLLRGLDRAALAATLALPLFLLHGRGIAEASIAVIDLCFVARSAMLRDWTWLRTPWLLVGLAWWAWLLLCSVPAGDLGQGGFPSFVQALLTVRFLLFVAALECSVLREARWRNWLWRMIAAAAAYIVANTLLQFAWGRNFYGFPRSGDGELTGPFEEARAGAPLSRLLFPALLPPLAVLLARPGLAARAAAAGLAVLGLAVMVLIGQRMPVLLTGLGVVVSALFLPRLRLLLLATAVAAGALLAASAVISPPTWYRLVTKFSFQMEHFQASPYGALLDRSLVIAEKNRWTGRGFDGFRTGCRLPAYFHGWTWPENPADDGGGAAICNEHPHNHYLQAVTDAGIPGLLLFSALVVAWLASLARGLWQRPDPLRVGLFVAALIQEWPIASASSVTSMPLSGWFFLSLGLGLAAARWQRR